MPLSKRPQPQPRVKFVLLLIEQASQALAQGKSRYDELMGVSDEEYAWLAETLKDLSAEVNVFRKAVKIGTQKADEANAEEADPSEVTADA